MAHSLADSCLVFWLDAEAIWVGQPRGREDRDPERDELIVALLFAAVMTPLGDGSAAPRTPPTLSGGRGARSTTSGGQTPNLPDTAGGGPATGRCNAYRPISPRRPGLGPGGKKRLSGFVNID